MFAKLNLLVWDSSKLQDLNVENIMVMLELPSFYVRYLISKDISKFKRPKYQDVSDFVFTKEELYNKNFEEFGKSLDWNKHFIVVGDIAKFQPVWEFISTNLPSDKKLIIVENAVVNLSEEFEETLKKDPRVVFNYI